MPRGNNNNNRGRGGGGRGRGRGRGRGGPIPHTSDRGGGPGHGPRTKYPCPNADFDFVVQEWAEERPGADIGGNSNRGRGSRGGGTPRSGAATPSRGLDSSRRGDSTPRGRGRGRGRGGPFGASRRTPVGFGAKGGSKGKVVNKDAPLSDLLYAERPLLKPVKFVRATFTPFLFQHSEELLEPTPQSADTTEASHVPTADRVARLFREATSDSDSDGNASDSLEEIDFADLAKVREEVDAIAEASKKPDAKPLTLEKIEEVDFADLGKVRAEVDSAGSHQPSRDAVIEETFTGVYNIKDANPMSSAMEAVDVEQQDSIDQSTAQPILAIPNNERLESIDVSKTSTNEPLPEVQDTIIVEEEINGTSNGSSDMITDESPSVSEPQPVANPDAPIATPVIPQPTSNPPITTSPQADRPPTNDSPPLFVIDTEPSKPFHKRSTSDVILVDRTGRGEMLGEEEELIVYVAPHPRSGRASPIPNIPRVKLPTTSILSGKSSATRVPAAVSGIRSPVREDELGEGIPGTSTNTNTAVQTQNCTTRIRTDDDYISLGLPEPTSAKQPRSKAALKARKKEARLQRVKQRNRKQNRSGFGSFGAMMEEAMLREEDARERRLPRWETRRRGDSDVDWGTDEGDDEGGEGEAEATGLDVVASDVEVDEISNGLGEMDLDPDLELDVAAMTGFVKSMSVEGSRVVTMDDIADQERMMQEDEEGQGGPMGSSDSESDQEEEEEAVFNVEEEIMIAESGGEEEGLSEDSEDEDEDEDDDDDDDDELSPKSSFETRLRKLRERSREQRPKEMQEISDDEEDLPEPHPFTRGADDEVFLAEITDLLEENSAILSGRDRKKRNALIRNLHQGYVDDYDIQDYLDDPEFTTPVKNKKGKKGKGKKQDGAPGIFDAELAAQWEKDRAKKAEYKRQRAAARLVAALDPSQSQSPHTSRKAMRAAARLDPELALTLTPNALTRSASVHALETQLRRFVSDVGGRRSLPFPPMDKGTRKVVHELAAAFGLTSNSKGKDEKRYTVVSRTSRVVNEGKVRAIVKRFGGGGGGGRDGKGRSTRVPRHKEGDEVGKEAPKIGEGNVGFRMLASMGWSEGDRIGGTASVGIEAPLMAIIKNSKLGLGATR